MSRGERWALSHVDPSLASPLASPRTFEIDEVFQKIGPSPDPHLVGRTTAGQPQRGDSFISSSGKVGTVTDWSFVCGPDAPRTELPRSICVDRRDLEPGERLVQIATPSAASRSVSDTDRDAP